MTQDGRAAALALLVAGAGWWLYTRSRGLTLTGQPANTMLLPNAATGNSFSPVAPSASVNVGATNVFSAIAQAVSQLGGIFARKQGGNAPAVSAPNYAGINPTMTGGPASNPGAPSIGSVLPVPDSSLDNSLPFWGWGFDPVAPAPIGVPALPWTVPPGFDVVPPPPGVLFA